MRNNTMGRMAAAGRTSRTAWARLAWVGVCVGLTGACVIIPFEPFGVKRRLEEVEVQPAKHFLTSNKALEIDITGMITSENGSGVFDDAEGTLPLLKDTLQKAAKDPNIAAIILRIDSPGGSVTASDVCYRELMEFKAKAAKERGAEIPVVAVMMDTAASGGYYIAMAADEVWAHPTTITGSIGVIAMLPWLKGLGDKIGVTIRVIKSGELKDIGSPWRDFEPKEKEVFQQMIDSLHAQFVSVVARGRNLDEAAVRALADGRIYTAQQALDAKLIDRIGYFDEAFEAAKKRAGIKDASIVAYTRSVGGKSNVYAAARRPAARPAEASPGAPAQVNLIHIDLGPWARADAPRFHYLWLP